MDPLVIAVTPYGVMPSVRLDRTRIGHRSRQGRFRVSAIPPPHAHRHAGLPQRDLSDFRQKALDCRADTACSYDW